MSMSANAVERKEVEDRPESRAGPEGRKGPGASRSPANVLCSEALN